MMKKKHNWISTLKEMPREGQQVLTLFDDGDDLDMAFAIYGDGKFFEGEMNTDNMYTENVLYWMPLPNRPPRIEYEGRLNG